MGIHILQILLHVDRVGFNPHFLRIVNRRAVTTGDVVPRINALTSLFPATIFYEINNFIKLTVGGCFLRRDLRRHRTGEIFRKQLKSSEFLKKQKKCSFYQKCQEFGLAT